MATRQQSAAPWYYNGPPRHPPAWQQQPQQPPPPPFAHPGHPYPAYNPYAQPYPPPPPPPHAHPHRAPPYAPPPAHLPQHLHGQPIHHLPPQHPIHQQPFHPPPLSQLPPPAHAPAPAPAPAEQSHPQSPSSQQPLPGADDEAGAVPATEWVISRWRYHHTSAPGLVFSPLARPPQRILDEALDFPPAPKPAPRPKPKTRRQQPHPPVPGQPQQPQAEEQPPPPPPASLPAAPETPPPEPKPETPPAQPAQSVQPAPAALDAPGVSSVAETTPATSISPETPTPHSPLSTNTSLSASPQTVNDTKPSTPPAAEQQLEDEKLQDEPKASTPEPAAAPAPAPAPVPAPAKPPVKKSWADLLRSGDKSGKLPTSSVVGVSVPADTPRSASVSPAKRQATQAILQLLSAPPPAQGAQPPIRPRGLINGGNLCFANAILQALVYCTPFHRLFVELGRLSAAAAAAPATQSKLRGAVGARLGATPTPLVDATINFLDEFAPVPAQTASEERDRARSPSGDSDAFIPTYIYDALKEKKRFDSMRRGHQEDAEEFLGFYLDTLEEELLALLADLSPAASGSKQPGPVAAKSEVVEESGSELGVNEEGWTEVGRRNRAVVVTNIKTTESPISRVFGGKFRSVLRTPGTGRDSVMVQDWNRLQLDIQPPHVNSITDALRNLSAPELVQVGPSSTEATKQVQLDVLPAVLVLHLKRFAYDPTLGGGGVVKNGKRIAFEPELEFGNDVMAPARRSARPPRYKLYAVVYHHGQSATGGHYTLDVLHPAPGHVGTPWVRLDDDIISRVRTEDVFGHDGADDKSAYLLFYRPVRPIAAVAAS
ncbi:cysteine proteinase [Auricularia subglabra TFB-10046 SS5]|nr:cysteine proteinase [Auricularia subglabra TFB-10046 SS5]